jgi:hypothetical protein
MPLINISFPGNASLISMVLFNIANFDVLPADTISSSLFPFMNSSDDEGGESKDVSFRFQAMGYDSANFIRNAGTSFYLLLIWLFGLCLVMFLKLIKGKNKRI